MKKSLASFRDAFASKYNTFDTLLNSLVNLLKLLFCKWSNKIHFRDYSLAAVLHY